MNIPKIGETWMGQYRNNQKTFTVSSIMPEPQFLLDYVNELEKSDKWNGNINIQNLIVTIRQRAASGRYNPDTRIYTLDLHLPDGSNKRMFCLERDFGDELYWKDLHQDA